jgi:hypothetical protein
LVFTFAQLVHADQKIVLGGVEGARFFAKVLVSGWSGANLDTYAFLRAPPQ